MEGVAREEWRLDVGEAVALGGRWEIAATAIWPERGAVRPSALVFCQPGGYLSRRYFDLGDPADPSQRGYSMAAWLASEAGLAVVSVDHLGIGDSTRPSSDDEAYQLDIDAVVRANHSALVQACERVAKRFEISADALPVVGLGHSMGSLLSVALQANHRAFAALVLQSFSTAGLPAFLQGDEPGFANDPDGARAAMPELVRARFGGPYPSMPGADADGRSQAFGVGTAPEVAKEMLGDASTRLAAMCGLATMIPGVYAPYAERVDVPVFVNSGDHDLGTAAPAASMLPRSPEVVAYTLADSWHCHNVANTRVRLWDRTARWIGSLLPR